MSGRCARAPAPADGTLNAARARGYLHAALVAAAADGGAGSSTVAQPNIDTSNKSSIRSYT